MKNPMPVTSVQSAEKIESVLRKQTNWRDLWYYQKTQGRVYRNCWKITKTICKHITLPSGQQYGSAIEQTNEKQ